MSDSQIWSAETAAAIASGATLRASASRRSFQPEPGQFQRKRYSWSTIASWASAGEETVTRAGSSRFRHAAAASRPSESRPDIPPRFIGRSYSACALAAGDFPRPLRSRLRGLRHFRHLLLLRAGRVELGGELPGGLRAVALVDPFLEEVDRDRLVGRRRRGHPAALAQTVGGRRDERQHEGDRARAGQLARDAERLALQAEVREGLVVDREVEMTRPRALGVSARIGQAEGAQLLERGVAGSPGTRHGAWYDRSPVPDAEPPTNFRPAVPVRAGRRTRVSPVRSRVPNGRVPVMLALPMSTPELPERARVVVIGGGVIGCSVAYHLAHM